MTAFYDCIPKLSLTVYSSFRFTRSITSVLSPLSYLWLNYPLFSENFTDKHFQLLVISYPLLQIGPPFIKFRTDLLTVQSVGTGWAPLKRGLVS